MIKLNLSVTLGTAALAMGLWLNAAEAARPKPKVSFGTRKVTPKTARGGTSAVATVKITTKGGAQVSQVSLRVVGAGAAPGGLAMQPQSNGKWSRTFTLPANYGTKPATLSVWADAQTSLGVRSIKNRPGEGTAESQRPEFPTATATYLSYGSQSLVRSARPRV